jgi:hypothetical protein
VVERAAVKVGLALDARVIQTLLSIFHYWLSIVHTKCSNKRRLDDLNVHTYQSEKDAKLAKKLGQL